MISFKDFQADYLDYAARNRLLVFLEGSHSQEDLNALMLLILEGEERILHSFGLPGTLANSSMLQVALNEDFGLADIALLYEQLCTEADRHLGGSVLTDLELMEVAQKWGLNVDEVLPQTSLKLKAEAYYHYLYAEYLLPGNITPEAFLKEIRIVAENKLADRLHQLTNDPDWRGSEEYETLAGFGLLYLADFMLGYGKFKRDTELNTDFDQLGTYVL